MVLPFLLSLVLAVVEVGRGLEVSHLLTVAVREGTRFGAMDKEGILLEGQTSNDKVIADVKNYLWAAGLPKDQITVTITAETASADDPKVPFDLDDPANDQLLFRVKVELQYSAISYMPAYFLEDKKLDASAVFRNTQQTLVQ